MENISNKAALHIKQIEYATTKNRILVSHWIQTWNEFNSHTSNTIYFDLSAEDYRNEFISVVLPSINKYDLTNQQKRVVQQLNHNEFYLSTDEGFKYLRNKEPVYPSDSTIDDITTETIDFSVKILSTKSFHKTELKGKHNYATIPAISAASVAVSTMPELVVRKLLTPDIIIQRLRKNGANLVYKTNVSKIRKYDVYTKQFHAFLQNKYKRHADASSSLITTNDWDDSSPGQEFSRPVQRVLEE